MFRILPYLLASLLAQTSGHELELAGEWRFHLPTLEQVDTANPKELAFEQLLQLPGMMTAQGFSEVPSINTQWTGGGWSYREMFAEFQTTDNFKFPFFLKKIKNR